MRTLMIEAKSVDFLARYSPSDTTTDLAVIIDTMPTLVRIDIIVFSREICFCRAALFYLFYVAFRGYEVFTFILPQAGPDDAAVERRKIARPGERQFVVAEEYAPYVLDGELTARLRKVREATVGAVTPDTFMQAVRSAFRDEIDTTILRAFKRFPAYDKIPSTPLALTLHLIHQTALGKIYSLDESKRLSPIGGRANPYLLTPFLSEDAPPKVIKSYTGRSKSSIERHVE
ncbi:MAG: hypothetical protein LBC42_01950, partial [Puniceicoccales bacterium]|nr:hypothetical protein [Puniceicoccales bacterium]